MELAHKHPQVCQRYYVVLVSSDDRLNDITVMHKNYKNIQYSTNSFCADIQFFAINTKPVVR